MPLFPSLLLQLDVVFERSLQKRAVLRADVAAEVAFLRVYRLITRIRRKGKVRTYTETTHGGARGNKGPTVDASRCHTLKLLFDRTLPGSNVVGGAWFQNVDEFQYHETERASFPIDDSATAKNP